MAGYWVDKMDTEDFDLNTDRPSSLTWRRGWVDALGFNEASEEAVQAALKRRALLRCVRELRLLYSHRDNKSGFYSLLKGDFFGNVRVFQDGDGGHESGQCYFSGDVPTEDYLKKMPRLEEVHLYARCASLGWLFARALPHLRQLTVYHETGYPLEVLARNRTLANLTHLFCWPRSQLNEDDVGEGGAYITRAGVTALVRSPNLPSLQHLQLCLSDLGDEGMRILVESGILKRLKTLNLHGGLITDAGARILAECPDLRHLEALTLSRNYLSPAGVRLLRDTGVPLYAENQLGEDAVETHEHLNDGDCE
jgi:hypothetical protein